MISGNFLENLFKVKTSFFVFFVVFVFITILLDPSENSWWFWLDPLNLLGDFNKKNHILSILFLFSLLKIVVRIWEWLVSLSSYGKMYYEIIEENNAINLIEIGVQKLLIDFIEFNHSGLVRLNGNKVVILVQNHPTFECVVTNSKITDIFTKHAFKGTNSNSYEARNNYNSDAGDPNIMSNQFKAEIMNLKKQLKDSDCKIYSFLQTECLGNLFLKSVCVIKNNLSKKIKLKK